MTRIIKHILPFGITNVLNYSALPAANTVAGKYYYCRQSEGTPYIGVLWGGSYHPNGIYYSDGVNWIETEIPFNATQATVDAGTDDQQFLTAKTFTNSAQLAGKANVNDTRIVKSAFRVSFDGQGGVILVNSNAIIPATANGGTVTGFYIEGDVSGSIEIDMKKNGTSMIGAGTKLDLISAVTNNGTISGWTTSTFVANDKIEFKVISASTLTKCWLVVNYDKTS